MFASRNPEKYRKSLPTSKKRIGYPSKGQIRECIPSLLFGERAKIFANGRIKREVGGRRKGFVFYGRVKDFSSLFSPLEWGP